MSCESDIYIEFLARYYKARLWLLNPLGDEAIWFYIRTRADDSIYFKLYKYSNGSGLCCRPVGILSIVDASTLISIFKQLGREYGLR